MSDAMVAGFMSPLQNLIYNSEANFVIGLFKTYMQQPPGPFIYFKLTNPTVSFFTVSGLIVGDDQVPVSNYATNN